MSETCVPMTDKEVGLYLEKMAKMAVRILMGWGLNFDQATELVADKISAVWLIAKLGRREFHTKSDVRNYFFAALRNGKLRAWTKSNRCKQEDADGEIMRSAVSRSPDPARSAYAKEVWRQSEQLPDIEGEMVRKVSSGMSQKEAAEELGIPYINGHRAYSRGIEAMRRWND